MSVEEVEKFKEFNKVTHVDVNFKEPKYSMTPLMIASVQGSRDIVVYLIHFNANINLRDIKGYKKNGNGGG